MKGEMIFRAVPELNFEIVCAGLDAVHVHFVLLGGESRFVMLADESSNERSLAAL